MDVIEIETLQGTAVAHVLPAPEPCGALVLGHGAGGGIAAPDLTTVAEAAHEAGFVVVLVEQPYRAAGRRAPPRAAALDAAWTAVLDHLRRDQLWGTVPLVVGGRSSGARVACRTAAVTGSAAVLCLAFPLQPSPREGRAPVPSRQPELDAVAVPVLVVQGDHDPFGMPSAAARRTVVTVTGDHSLRSDLGAVRSAALGWLEGVVRDAARAGPGLPA